MKKDGNKDFNSSNKKEDKSLIRILNQELNETLKIPKVKWIKNKGEENAFIATVNEMKNHPNYYIIGKKGRKSKQHFADYEEFINYAKEFFKKTLSENFCEEKLDDIVKRRKNLFCQRSKLKKSLLLLEATTDESENHSMLQKRKNQLKQGKIKHIKARIAEIDSILNENKSRLKGQDYKPIDTSIAEEPSSYERKQFIRRKLKEMKTEREKQNGTSTGENLALQKYKRTTKAQDKPKAVIIAEPLPTNPERKPEIKNEEDTENNRASSIIINSKWRRKNSCLQRANDTIKKYSLLCMKDEKTKDVSFNTLVLNYKIEYGYKDEINKGTLINNLSQLMTAYETTGYVEKTYGGINNERRFKFLKPIPEDLTLDELMGNAQFTKSYKQKQRQDFEIKLLYNYKLFIFNLMRDKKYNFSREDFEEYLSLRCDMVFQKLVDELLLIVQKLNYIKEINETKTYTILKKVEDTISLNGMRLKYQIAIKDGIGSKTNN